MATLRQPVHAQLWLRPPYLKAVKLTATPPRIVEEGKRKSGLERWLSNVQRKQNCTFLVPTSLTGGDDTWPKELRDWPKKATSWNAKPEQVAEDLLKWYPEEPCLVNAAAWLQETYSRYPDAYWDSDPVTGWPLKLLYLMFLLAFSWSLVYVTYTS